MLRATLALALLVNRLDVSACAIALASRVSATLYACALAAGVSAVCVSCGDTSSVIGRVNETDERGCAERAVEALGQHRQQRLAIVEGGVGIVGALHVGPQVAGEGDGPARRPRLRPPRPTGEFGRLRRDRPCF